MVTYEVYCHIVDVRQVHVVIHGQEVIALALALKLGRELLRRDLRDRWLVEWDLHIVVGFAVHFAIS